MAFGKGKSSAKKGGKSEFDDTNRGVLFPNDKGENEARPDVTGNLAIDPEDYKVGDDGLIRFRLAGWYKSSDRIEGGQYISLSASPPKE